MKLRTELREQSPLTCDFGALKHDTAVAHALMQAIKDVSEATGFDVGWWIERRADEIMAGWGFDSGEDA